MLVLIVWLNGNQYEETFPVNMKLSAFADMVEMSDYLSHIEILSFDPSYSN